MLRKFVEILNFVNISFSNVDKSCSTLCGKHCFYKILQSLRKILNLWSINKWYIYTRRCRVRFKTSVELFCATLSQIIRRDEISCRKSTRFVCILLVEFACATTRKHKKIRNTHFSFHSESKNTTKHCLHTESVMTYNLIGIFS